MPLYGNGQNVRDWLHVEDHCEALLSVLERGRAGEVYHALERARDMMDEPGPQTP